MARNTIRKTRGGRRGKGTINVSFDLDPSPQALAKQNRELGERLKDFRPVWEKMIPRLRQHMAGVWMSQGARAGERWPKWKKSYAKRRPNGAIGILTGKLMKQVTTKGVLSKTKSTLRFGARGKGVRAFHFGFGTGRKGSRARPYVVATPAVMKMAAEAWRDHIDEMAKQWPMAVGRAKANGIIRRKAA